MQKQDNIEQEKSQVETESNQSEVIETSKTTSQAENNEVIETNR